jgi:hypothetical protein
MISVARFWLSVSLMLLQLAAPLIHAHKNDSNFSGSFHLPEFEQINLLIEQSSMLFVPAAQSDQIVTISAGMKNNQRRVLSKDDFEILIMLSLVMFSLFQCSLIKHFVKTEQTNFFNVLNLNAPPRAPPFSLVC